MDFGFFIGWKTFLKLLFKILKWGTRAFLAGFVGLGLWLQFGYGIPFFENFIHDHTTITSCLIYLFCLSCIAKPFVRVKKKQPYGGETVMQKFTAAMVIIVASCLALVIISLLYPGLVTETLLNAGGGILVGVVDGWNSFCVMLGSAQNGIAAGVIGTGASAIFWYYILSPRTPLGENKTKQTETPWAQTAPTTYNQPNQPTTPQPVAPQQKQES
jgi:hypothetical protein